MANIDTKALFKIGYGLYVVTSFDGKRHNGLIVNTVVQLTSEPLRVGVAINKNNYSHGVIKESGKMNVCTLTEEAPFKVFEAFGFSSGRDKDKFEGCTPRYSENGLAVLPKYINSFMSLCVDEYIDLGTHGLFICSLTESEVLSDAESMTYSYYHRNVKPNPTAVKSPSAEKSDERAASDVKENQAPSAKKYVCTLCGYVHEGELPDGFECPWCKHGKEFFEEVAD